MHVAFNSYNKRHFTRYALTLTPSSYTTTQCQYRVVGQSGATVRKDINLDSPLVANLEKDSIVDISTIKGRRAHIVSPVEGWSSIKTETGYVILKKEGGEMYKYRIVLKEGAVIRKGADIDASEVGHSS